MYLTRSETRRVDQRAIDEFGIPGIVLMENAGRGAAELLAALGVHGPVTICCGKGNNGGDGFVVARHLMIREVSVRVILFARPEDLQGDAATNYQAAKNIGIPVAVQSSASIDVESLQLTRDEWVVDALFGTGLKGPVRPPFDRVISSINCCGAKILAIDIPSGLDCDTGQPSGPTIRADHTVTFVALKEGFANPVAQEWLGKVHIRDIGISYPG